MLGSFITGRFSSFRYWLVTSVTGSSGGLSLGVALIQATIIRSVVSKMNDDIKTISTFNFGFLKAFCILDSPLFLTCTDNTIFFQSSQANLIDTESHILIHSGIK